MKNFILFNFILLSMSAFALPHAHLLSRSAKESFKVSKFAVKESSKPVKFVLKQLF